MPGLGGEAAEAAVVRGTSRHSYLGLTRALVELTPAALVAVTRVSSDRRRVGDDQQGMLVVAGDRADVRLLAWLQAGFGGYLRWVT